MAFRIRSSLIRVCSSVLTFDSWCQQCVGFSGGNELHTRRISTLDVLPKPITSFSTYQPGRTINGGGGTIALFHHASTTGANMPQRTTMKSTKSTFSDGDQTTETNGWDRNSSIGQMDWDAMRPAGDKHDREMLKLKEESPQNVQAMTGDQVKPSKPNKREYNNLESFIDNWSKPVDNHKDNKTEITINDSKYRKEKINTQCLNPFEDEESNSADVNSGNEVIGSTNPFDEEDITAETNNEPRVCGNPFGKDDITPETNNEPPVIGNPFGDQSESDCENDNDGLISGEGVEKTIRTQETNKLPNLHTSETNKPPNLHTQKTNKPPNLHTQETNKPPNLHTQETNKPPNLHTQETNKLPTQDYDTSSIIIQAYPVSASGHAPSLYHEKELTPTSSRFSKSLRQTQSVETLSKITYSESDDQITIDHRNNLKDQNEDKFNVSLNSVKQQHEGNDKDLGNPKEQPEPAVEDSDCPNSASTPSKRDILTTGNDEEGDVVLVTGGNGFLGQHIVKMLQLKAPHVKEIRVLDKDPFEQKLEYEATKPVKTFTGSITDPASVTSSIRGVTSVVHIAGLVSFGTFPDIEGMQKVNVNGTRNIINVCLEQPSVSRVIYCSTVDVVVGHEPIRGGDETNTQVPREFLFPGYPQTKYQAEKLVLGASRRQRKHGGRRLQTLALRANVMYGELDPYYVTSALKMAKQRNGVLTQIGDGSAMFQQSYVGNTAWAFVCADRAMRNAPRLTSRFFYVPDHTPIQNSFNFMRPYLEDRGFQLSPNHVSYNLVYGAIYAAEKMAKLVSPLKKVSLPTESCSIAYINTDLFFRGDKAREVLQYQPLFSPAEARVVSMEYYKNVQI